MAKIAGVVFLSLLIFGFRPAFGQDAGKIQASVPSPGMVNAGETITFQTIILNEGKTSWNTGAYSVGIDIYDTQNTLKLSIEVSYEGPLVIPGDSALFLIPFSVPEDLSGRYQYKVRLEYRHQTLAASNFYNFVVLAKPQAGKAKPQAEGLTSLIAQSFQNNFKPAKIEVLPAETVNSCASYQALDPKKYYAEITPHASGSGGAWWEYLNQSQWMIPALGLKFINGEEHRKVLFPALVTESGADAVMVVQVVLLRYTVDDIMIGDCFVEIYAPSKSGKETVLAYSACIKAPGGPGIKRDDWKNKDKDGTYKNIEEYWPKFAKLFDNFFAGYGILADESIK